MVEYKVLSRREKSALLAKAGIKKVYDLAREAKPNHQWSLVGNKIHGKCTFPGHQDKNPSMDIIFTDDGHTYQKCMACKQYTSDGFKIISHLTDIHDPLRVHAEIFGQRFNLSLPEEMEDALAQEQQFQLVKRELMVAANQVLTQAMSSNADEFNYARSALKLLKSRGIDLNMLPIYQLGVFPTLQHFHRYADQDAVTLAPEYLGGRVFESKPVAVGRYGGWLMFPYFTTESHIGRLKLRNPNDKRQEAYLGKHRREPRGFFGLHMFATFVGSSQDAARTAYIVEGEFDQLSLYQAQQKLNANDQYIVLGGSGTGSSDLDLLANSGIRSAVLIGDNDPAGDAFNKNVLRHMSQKSVRDVAVYSWPDDIKHNDPDDVVKAGDYAKFWKTVTTRSRVVELSTWAANMVEDEVAQLKMPRTLEKIDIANEYGQLIQDKVERDLFVTDVSQRIDVDSALLAKHVVVNDTEEGFRINMERVLGEYAEPVAMLDYNKALLYSKPDRTLFEVSLNKPRDIELAMQTRVFKMKAFNFIQAKIGIPDWIRMDMRTKKPKPKTSTGQARIVQNHFDWAVQNFVAQSGPIEQYHIRRQGIHWADAGLDPLDKQMLPEDHPERRIYMVNGNDLYAGTEGGDGFTHFERLDTPIEGAFLFWASRGEQWSHVLDVDDLMREPVYTPQECYEMLRRIMDCWSFKNHEEHAQFFAAQFLTWPVAMLFDYLPFVFLTAPTQAGKSTLLKGLIGGVDPKSIGVLECTRAFDDYTAAGVMQTAAETSFIHCLDEWEDPDTAKSTTKSKAVRSLLEMTRNLSGGMVRTRGTTHGVSREQYLRFPIVAAGIVPHQEAVDLNRWFTVELDKKEGHQPPEKAIRSMFTDQELQDLRESLTLNALQQAHILKKHEEQLFKEIFDEHKIDVRQSRFAKAMISSLVGLRWAGQDALKFGQSFLKFNEDYVNQTDVTEEQQLFRAVMETNAIKLPNDIAPRSALSALADPETRDLLSDANCGVYYVSGTDVAVLYADKLREILKNSAKYRTTTNQHQIFSLLRRHPLVHHDPQFIIQNPSIFIHLRRYISTPKPQELLFVRLSDLQFSQTNPVHYGAGSDDL